MDTMRVLDYLLGSGTLLSGSYSKIRVRIAFFKQNIWLYDWVSLPYIHLFDSVINAYMKVSLLQSCSYTEEVNTERRQIY